MGVDYGATVGWGIAIPVDNMPQGMFDNFHEDGGIQEWLDEMKVIDIEYRYEGNHMNGETFCCFFAKGTSESVDLSYGDGIRELGDYAAWGSSGFYDVIEALGLSARYYTVGWKLIFTVS